MKNKIKKTMLWHLVLIGAFYMQTLAGFVHASTPQNTCPAPQATLTSATTGTASFSWTPVPGASQYVVFYVRHEDNYTSQPIYTSNTSITCSGLPAGTYDFYFATVCSGSLSEGIIIEDLVL